MSPAPRRRSKPANSPEPTDTETTEVEATEGETEGEDAPKRTRAPKLYTVKDADLANELVGDDFEDEIAEGDPVTGEMLNSMRGAKAKWDSPEDGGIKHVFGMNSAIPLRNMLNKWLAEQSDEDKLTLDDVDELYALLIDQGAGWVTLAALTDSTVNEVKEALKQKVADEKEVDITDGGRAYGKGENWRWVTAEELNEAKAANGNGSDEEGDEEGEESDEDSDDSEDEAEDDTEAEAPAPKRRRRTPAA
jgi:hypothetical protein